MKYLTAILKTVGPSLIIPFTVLCAFPVLVFFAISHTNDPKAIEQFITILTSQSNCQKKNPKHSNSYF